MGVAIALALTLAIAACSSDAGVDASADDETSVTSETETDVSSTETTGTTASSNEDTSATTTDEQTPSLPTVSGDDDDTSQPDDTTEADDTTPDGPVDELALPTTAAELAAAINDAELALRAPGVDQASGAPWGRRQQALYRVLAFNPEWEAEVLAAIDPTVKPAVELNWQARQELISLVNTHGLTETLPAWRIEPPPPADELLGYYREAEAATGVPWEILASINLVETRMGRIQGISSAGALGPMQFLPTTWAECCEGDPTNPRDAINGAGKYLVQRGGDTDLERAIFGYNNSDYYVTAITSYAAVMEADESAYYGYHAWQVYFLSTEGLIVIPEGYEQQEPIAVTEWLEANPETLFER